MTRGRSRRLLGALVFTGVVGLGVGLGHRAWSDDTAGASPAAPATAIASTDIEKEAVRVLELGRPVTARRLAEGILDGDPDSIAGHYVLGRVLYEAEGDLGQAIYHLGHARELYESRYPVDRPADGPWQFHRELLYTIAQLAAQMEEYDYQLEILDFHDAIYRPQLIGEHAWPLMKLGRMDDARAAATAARDGKSPAQRSLGLNTLCAIERASHVRAAARTACTASFEYAKQQDALLPEKDKAHESTVAVHAYNAALAARADLADADAERLALEGAQRLAFTPANPWRFLVTLYTEQGRGADATRALRSMHEWRVRQPPQLRDQDRAETEATIASVLLLAGRTEPALRLIDRALASPDRRGLSSGQAWQERGAHALLRRAIRRAHDETLAEEAAADRGGRRLIDAVGERVRDWGDDEEIRGALSDDDRLIDSFRFFGERGLNPVPTWLLGDLVEVLGPGVIAVVLREARAAEDDARLSAYFDAIEAEVHLARGRTDEARRLATAALDQLPSTEVLLRARAAATAAEAALEDDDEPRALEMLTQAYQLDPSVLRRRGLALPARIQASGGGDAETVADMLRASPRFTDASGAFEVEVVESQGSFRICLRDATGAELSCVDVAPEEPKEPGPGMPPAPPPAEGQAAPAPITPADAALRFQRQAFALPLGLTGVDMTSLDGTTTVADQAVRDQVEDLLDGATGP